MKTLLLSLVTFILATSLPAQMSGTFTIDPASPPSAANFVTLASASSALATQGVGGPVEFLIFGTAASPYLESAVFIPGISLGANNAAWVLASWPGTSPVNTVTFRAAPGQSPVIDANGQAVVVYWNGADYTTLEGLELRNASFDAVCMYTPSGDPAGTLPGTGTALSNTITRCHIHSCGAVGVLFYANSGQLNDTTISNNFFHTLVTSTSRGGFSGFVRDGYVAGRRDSGTRILNNTFLIDTLGGPAETSVAAIIEYHDGAANRTGITHIEGNIIHKLIPNGTVYKFYNSTIPPIPSPFDNNCLWDVGGGTNFADYFGTTYTNAGNWVLSSGADASSIIADPLLASTVVPFDLHIQPASPCTSAIAPIAGITVDYDGDPRAGQLTSIGADEYVSGCAFVEYETNDAVLSATVNNTIGSPCVPAALTLPQSFPGSAQLNSTNLGFGFEAIFAPAALIPATGGAFITGGGQILNVPLNVAPLIFINGGAVPSFATPFPGNLTLNFLTPPSSLLISMQVAIVDPTHPDFFRISQGTQLTVL
jgi:hypothetical protein